MLGDSRRGSGAAGETMLPSGGAAKTETKAVSEVVIFSSRPGRRSAVVAEADTRATDLPGGAEWSAVLLRGPCARKLTKLEEAKGIPPKTALSGRGTSPPKPTPVSVKNECETRWPGEQDNTILYGGEAVRPTVVVFRGRLGLTGYTIGVSVGAVFAFFECVVERGEKLGAGVGEERVRDPLARRAR